MNKDIKRTAQQKNPDHKNGSKLATTGMAEAAGNKPDGTKDGQQPTRHTQQQDDDDGYPRTWYSPKNPRVKTSLQMKGWQDHSTFITAIVSIIALIVIIWQGFIYVNQNRLMDRQNTEMRDTRELENRAWVGVKDAALVAAQDRRVDIIVTYVNGGNSPALCTVEFGAMILTSSPPNNYDFGGFPWQGSKFAMLPNSETRSTIISLPGLPFTGTEDREHAYYVLGKISYTDIFSNSHTTKWCYRVEWERPDVRLKDAPPPKNPRRAILAVCPTHNSFD